MSPAHVADSVRIALGSDADCVTLAAELEDTALPTRICESVEAVVDFQPAAVVLDQQLASEPFLLEIKNALPHVVLIARSDITRDVEFPLPKDLDSQMRILKTACELFATRSLAAEQRKMAQSAEADLDYLLEKEEVEKLLH